MKIKIISLILIFTAAGLLIFLARHNPVFSTANNFIINTRASVYSRFSTIGSLAAEIKKTKSLMDENLRLKDENLSLLSRLARQSEFEKENDSLREALNLPVPGDRKILDGGIFNIQFSPEGYYVLINKGLNDGVGEKDIIITSSGVLIGTVDKVFDDFSRVSTVMNYDFKATISVFSKEISGIAKGAMGDGLSLDFISQNDEISEGDTIVSNGNDLFPRGMIIGTVMTVNSEDGSLFKDVIVEPALKRTTLNKILILKKRP